MHNECPYCGSSAELVSERQIDPDHVRRTYRCSRCKRTHMTVVKQLGVRFGAEQA